MRTMYDGINPAGLPADAQIVAGYVDGHWPSLAGLIRRFPNAAHLSIAVDPAHDADILDCETGDALPGQCPAWVARQRARGVEPTVYCNEGAWAGVRSMFTAAGVAEPCWWVANYDGAATLPPGASAKQYENTPGYDVSVIADHWPTLDGRTDDMSAAAEAQIAALYARLQAFDQLLFNVNGGSGQPGLRQVIGTIAVEVGAHPATPAATDVQALAADLAAFLAPDLLGQLAAELTAAAGKATPAATPPA